MSIDTIIYASGRNYYMIFVAVAIHFAYFLFLSLFVIKELELVTKIKHFETIITNHIA